jgi:hypothetical protein
MTTDAKLLNRRELARRKALWKLEHLHPGDPAASILLLELDLFDRSQRTEPCGADCSITLEQVCTSVRAVSHNGMSIIPDESIPQPWRARFEAASYGSTRTRVGGYEADWHTFVSLWAQEMQHLQAHRDARN